MNRICSHLSWCILVPALSFAPVGCSASAPTASDSPATSSPAGSTLKPEDGWSLDSLKEERTFTGHSAFVMGVALSARGHRAVSCGFDKTVRIWDVESGKELHRIDVPEGVSKVAMSPDGRHVLYGGTTRTVEGSTATTTFQLRLCDTETGKEIRRLPDVRDMVDSVVFSPDGTRALSGGSPRAYLWDVNAGKLLHTFTDIQNHAYAVAFSPDGKRGLAVSGNNVLVLDLEKMTTLGTFSGSKNLPMALAFSPDGRKALSGGFDNTVRLWDVATQKEDRAMTNHTGQVLRVAFLPDKRHAVSGAADGTIRFWNLETGKEVECLKNQLGREYALAVSTNGQWLLFGTKDHAVRLQKAPRLPLDRVSGG